MDESRIDSQGFSVGRWCFPPFTLRRGECITLVLPSEAYADQDSIIAALTGLEPVAGLTIHATVVRAEWAFMPTGWRRWLIGCTPYHWMKKYSALSDDAIASFLREHHMDKNLPLHSYAGTPRTVLGLVAAYARKPGGIVFSTSGIDPLGVRASFKIVSDHLPECSAIYLAWPFISQGQEHHSHFPDSLNLSVVDKEGSLVQGNSGMSLSS